MQIIYELDDKVSLPEDETNFLDEFRRFLRKKGYTRGTATHYVSCVRTYLGFLKGDINNPKRMQEKIRIGERLAKRIEVGWDNTSDIKYPKKNKHSEEKVEKILDQIADNMAKQGYKHNTIKSYIGYANVYLTQNQEFSTWKLGKSVVKRFYDEKTTENG